MDFFMRTAALFAQGGPAMYLILLCSFFVVFIAAERWMYFRSIRPLPVDFSGHLQDLVERGGLAEAVALCRAAENTAAQAAAAGLLHMEQAGPRLALVLEGEASLAAARLRKNLNHLESVVTAAPLLGLLGTVIGMIDSFQVMNIKTGQPLAITGGVGEALIATAFGLCTAILAMTVHSYFSHRLEQRITEMEEIFAVLIRGAR